MDQTIETAGTDQAAESYEKAQHNKNIIFGMDAVNAFSQYEEKAKTPLLCSGVFDLVCIFVGFFGG